MNKGVLIFLGVPAFNFPEVELLDHLATLFSTILKKQSIVLYGICLILHPRHQYTRATISPTTPPTPHTTTQENWTFFFFFFFKVLCSLLPLDLGVCSFLFPASCMPLPKHSTSFRSLPTCHFLWEDFEIPQMNFSYCISIHTLFYHNTCHNSLLLESSSCLGQG